MKTERQTEVDKYVAAYNQDQYEYRMGGQRRIDATCDLYWAKSLGCKSLLDIGCGRGEMLSTGRELGMLARGTEVVPELCDGEDVVELPVHSLGMLHDETFDLVTSFDVIEHLVRDDDRILILEMGRIARKCIALTANNHPSVDPTTGANLHINIRSYEAWDGIIREILEPDGWTVEQQTNKQYVSETWRAWKR